MSEAASRLVAKGYIKVGNEWSKFIMPYRIIYNPKVRYLQVTYAATAKDALYIQDWDRSKGVEILEAIETLAKLDMIKKLEVPTDD